MTNNQVLATGLALTGRVHSALRPLPGTMLTLTDRAGMQVGRARTAPDGTFQLAGLAPGSYVVIFSRAGYLPHAAVVMLGATTAPLDVVLEPAISVQGIVHDRDSGQPVSAATVTAVGPDGEVIASTVSDPDGAYRVTGIDADAIMLVVAAPGADPRATEVDLGRGADHVVDLALDTYSTLSGKVVVDGHPVAHLRLALTTVDGTAAVTTITDGTGAYRFDRIKAGQYVLASVTSAGRTVALAPGATNADVNL